ncbi:MAG: oxygenase MpaB family protein [Acidimicrobiales bacterium]
MPGGPADVPREIRDSMVGLALAAGGANVIMQLARLPVGRGVAESRVESGRVDRHPVKRLRTTTAYLLIAMLGTEPEREELRRQIDRVHAQVRSRPQDPVAYNAFDPELQLWVAACLYKGLEDVHRLFGPRVEERFFDDVLYPHAARLGTTLQVTDDMWPVDRAAFEAYWKEGIARIEMDEVTRPYLRGIADLSFVVARLGPLGGPLRRVLRPLGEVMTGGFLPAELRDELGLPWGAARQRRFDGVARAASAVSRRLPRPVRELPLNLYLRDTQHRLRTGRPVV